MLNVALILLGVAALVAVAASVLFLRTRNFFYDSLALATTESGLVLLAVVMLGGIVWIRRATGVWWSWDARLTATLICGLLYAAYLMLRDAVEEPTQRASAAAVVSILAFLDIPIVAVCIVWWRARHSAAAVVAWPAGYEVWTLIVVLALGSVMVRARLRKEERRRASDAARRADLTV